MTFGSFGIIKKEKADMRATKDNYFDRVLERDHGLHQWHGHDVNSGVDFDIWDIKRI